MDDDAFGVKDAPQEEEEIGIDQEKNKSDNESVGSGVTEEMETV